MGTTTPCCACSSARARMHPAPFLMAKPRNKVTSTDNAPPVSGTAPGAPVPPPLELGEAQTAVWSMASILFRIEREANGRFRVCRTVEDIRHCMKAGAVAAVFHIEGAEAIDPEF